MTVYSHDTTYTFFGAKFFFFLERSAKKIINHPRHHTHRVNLRGGSTIFFLVFSCEIGSCWLLGTPKTVILGYFCPFSTQKTQKKVPVVGLVYVKKIKYRGFARR